MKKLFLIFCLIGFLALYCNDELLNTINSVRLKIALDDLDRFCDTIERGIAIGFTVSGISAYRELKKMGAKTFWGRNPMLSAFSLTFALGAFSYGLLDVYKERETKKITKKVLESDISLCINNN